ncbi:MAG: recombinase family protein [Planctomycetia bacterium]|nr:recombinase family protein [Planctomycetia bacterium]
MIKNSFNPNECHPYVRYGRMSDPSQNPRSPEQQFAMIDETLRRVGFPWVHVRDYRDDGITGRLINKRAGFNQMLSDIKSGILQVDLILVDTYERFGRAEELPALRRRLYNRFGVLLLTADSMFCDPTTVQGKALAMVEAIRSTEDGRIKAHNVIRGKRDVARLKHWPGGEPPFGFKLQTVMSDRNGRTEVDYSILVPNPETSWILQLIFRTAHENGWGTGRLAKFCNAHEDIPATFKPFYAATVGYWLQNPIYYGELLWEAHNTGIVEDRRIRERNVEEDMLRIADFCEPLIAREIWDAIRALRQERSARIKAARARNSDASAKLIDAPVPGLALKYLLTGLVRCGHCNRAMTPSSTQPYTTQGGTVKRYVRYVCPGYLEGACPNGTRVSEDWLREQVVGTIRERLFPGS